MPKALQVVDAALRWKNDFQTRTDAKMAIATQFAFEAKPIIEWADSLADAGITIPVHIGIAGPAKLQTLIKFAIACGVGPSLKVLQKRAMDVTKLLLPYEPTDVLPNWPRTKLPTPISTSPTCISSRWAGSRPTPHGHKTMAAHLPSLPTPPEGPIHDQNDRRIQNQNRHHRL